MLKVITGLVFASIFVSSVSLFFKKQHSISVAQKVIQSISTPTNSITTSPTKMQLPQTKIIPQKLQVYQSFNNCGPASLSMLLSYFNINITQEELGQRLRPYQNPFGDNDDKSVTLPELAEESKKYSVIPYHRPNGNVKIAKQLIANDIPFIVRTWLNPHEDIGHYRVVRGYDDTSQEFIQDDSYQGENIRYSYAPFLEMWQPFNYEYLVLVKPEKEETVKSILGKNADWQASWEHALITAQHEEQKDSENIYPIFNQAVAYYYLGKYEQAIQKYEGVESRLPNRMLWYQIEPIQAYFKAKQYDKVFELTDSILNNQNRGFTELYVMRGRAFQEQGNIEAARNEYQMAVLYNKNSEAARNALNELK